MVEKLFEGLNAGRPARSILAGEEVELARDLFLLTMKKEIQVFNVGENDERLRMDSGSEPGMTDVLVISAKIESELSSLSEEDAKMFMDDLGIKESGLDKLIKKAYATLGLISFLTTGITESRAWTIPVGTKAPQAAAVIHTDFEKKFIKAKVCAYGEFVVNGGWKEAAEKGKVRFEGKDYEMRDGDVVEFMIGA